MLSSSLLKAHNSATRNLWNNIYTRLRESHIERCEELTWSLLVLRNVYPGQRIGKPPTKKIKHILC
jgi:hypothetical protein